ncbi:Na+/H+ antiporter NhaC family protein [Planctomycetes bacterium K23_9]|uniref:Na+/H+ antiporter NhaC family protein n=1 Tax=Stieleria marina TaxID=1930275 RepID=UPI0011A2E898
MLSFVGSRLATETWEISVQPTDADVAPEPLAVATDILKSEVIQQRKSTVSQVLDASSLQRVQQKMDADEAVVFADLELPADATPTDDAIRLTVGHHFGIWSILPAIITLSLCLVFREPLPALLLGIISAALILSRFDLTDAVLLPAMASTSAAGILLLYLWLLGGLLGIWAKTGAALAFADWTCAKFVRGPRSAKLVAWGLGILFFQGGTISTVLVGTTVRPITDRNRISPEELSYVVDSTASPIASLIAFNAWPAYVGALIFVPGVSYLATESDRIGFFFQCAPLSFYSIFAVLGTFLLSIDKAPVLGKRFREAIAKSRQVGRQSHPNDAVSKTENSVKVETTEPTGFEGDVREQIADGYHASAFEFAIPLIVLIVIAVGTGFLGSKPQVRWAFSAALVVAAMIALCRGLRMQSLIEGIGDGLKSVTVVSVILVMAVILGGLTKELGGGLYVSGMIGENAPHLIVPAVLFVMTGAMAFATGTSFGTYAIAFPLTMPLSLSIASGMAPESGEWFVMICFAAVLNGSVWGDQCSPISDTTILSSLVSGCDLMQHVRTQLVPACVAGFLAMVAWTVMTMIVT